MLLNATLCTELLLPSQRELSRRGAQVERRARATGLAIFAAHGIEIDDFSALSDRIPYPIAMALLENAIVVSRDGAFALHAGRAIERGDLGLFQLLTASAPTLRASIRLAIQYLPLVNDGAMLELAESDDVAIWKHRPAPGVHASPAAAEYLISAFCFAAGQMLGSSAPPLEIWMRHEAPPHEAAYTQIFGAPTRFGREHDAIVLPRRALDLPLVTADAPLLRVLERYAQEVLQRVQRWPPFLQRVRELSSARLATGGTLTELAEALHMSESSIQRRLQVFGTSYSGLLDDLRRERALELLANPELNFNEIAFQLGFAHRPAFHRAFKRWYGHSPAEHRERQQRSAFYRFYQHAGESRERSRHSKRGKRK
jgi:AraC-like DNA-binding protein